MNSSIIDNENRKIEVTVQDQGIGMTEQDMSKLFTPYFKTTDAKSKEMNASSHGLGLNICKKISKALGGDITVKSEYEKGCAFTFTFNAKFVVEVPINGKNKKTDDRLTDQQRAKNLKRKLAAKGKKHQKRAKEILKEEIDTIEELEEGSSSPDEELQDKFESNISIQI